MNEVSYDLITQILDFRLFVEPRKAFFPSWKTTSVEFQKISMRASCYSSASLGLWARRERTWRRFWTSSASPSSGRAMANFWWSFPIELRFSAWSAIRYPPTSLLLNQLHCKGNVTDSNLPTFSYRKYQPILIAGFLRELLPKLAFGCASCSNLTMEQLIAMTTPEKVKLWIQSKNSSD